MELDKGAVQGVNSQLDSPDSAAEGLDCKTVVREPAAVIKPLRIAFVTSSLERGKDGVGDYTRALGEECKRRGHEVFFLGLHDRHLAAEVQDTEPNLRRLPATSPWLERVQRAAACFEEWQPQWLSLQFVPYGFHDKGLAWKLADYLTPLLMERKAHVMFHELWIGGYRRARLKERMIGWVQRACVFRLIRQIRPATISTSNDAYLAMLKRAGFDSERLPLFGSIPFVEGAHTTWVRREVEAAGGPMTARNGVWIFAMFGTLHPGWPAEPLFSYLTEAAFESQKVIVILSIGRLGLGQALWEQLKARYGGKLHFVQLGERSPLEVSEAIQASDFGIATSPWQLIGKSSSVAAMLEHGLPVIVNRDDEKFRGVAGDMGAVAPLLIKMDNELPRRLPTLRRGPARSTLPDVASKFLGYLEGSPQYPVSR
jgi:hypothetical protein